MLNIREDFFENNWIIIGSKIAFFIFSDFLLKYWDHVISLGYLEGQKEHDHKIKIDLNYYVGEYF